MATDRRRWQIAALLVMCAIGIGLGVWLFRRGEVALGAFFIGVWFFSAQRYSLWLMIPETAPRESPARLGLRSQRLLFLAVCLSAAAVCALGIYLCYWWPEQWEAGFVFVLLGFVILIPISVAEIRYRKKPHK